MNQDLELDFNTVPNPAKTLPKASSQEKKKDHHQKEQPASDEELTFEGSLKRLETIVAQMEGGQLTLEQSMNCFEEGTKLANFCSSQLAETESKIEILLGKNKKAWQDFPQQSAPDDSE